MVWFGFASESYKNEQCSRTCSRKPTFEGRPENPAEGSLPLNNKYFGSEFLFLFID